MTLTIGRIGVATSGGGDGWALAGPITAQRNGAELTLEGALYGYTAAELAWRVASLKGLAHLEEPVIPVTFADNSGFDGYYRVVGVDCDLVTVGSDGYVPWTVTLAEVLNFRYPRIDMVTGYGLMPNGHSITAYDAVVAFPGTAVDAYGPFPAAPDVSTTRPVGDGSSVVLLLDTGATSTGTSGTGKLVVAPGDYYHGGARIEWDIGSSVFRHAVGRVDFRPAGVLRLSNGLVRATVTYGNSSTSRLDVQWWDGSQWDTATEFYLEGVTTHGELVYNSARVVRNTAEQCSLKFSTIPASFSSGPVDVTFSVRRGQRWVSAYCESVNAPSGGWRVGFSTSIAATSITGGVMRTLNNAGGNREILTGQYATTKDTGNGRVTTASLPAALLAIGCEVAGSAAVGQNTAANQIEEWFCSLNERAVVVAL